MYRTLLKAREVEYFLRDSGARVVVTGEQSAGPVLEAAGTVGVDAVADGAQLLGFYVADPDPGASFWLGEDRFIPIDRWLGELFSPVTYLTPHTGVPGDIWQNRMVAIQRSWTAGGPSDAGQRNATAASYA